MTTTDIEAYFAMARQEMVEQIALHAVLAGAQTGITAISEQVMTVMGNVPRHEFLPEELQIYAYLDQPLPIGFGKTISQPFIVALMTDLLRIQPGDRVLEIGTGLGYQAAILAELARQVYSIEMIGELSQEAIYRLHRQGYGNIHLRVGDGSCGWPEHAPFDKIIVTAAPELIPVALLNQLKAGGRMVIPVGLESAQQLMLVERDRAGSLHTQELLPVRFSSLMITQ